MSTLLVSGANRGLGLELVRQYEADGWRIHAGCRDPEAAEELSALAAQSTGRVSIHALDVSDFAAIDALAGTLRGEPIDVVVNNAGIYAPAAAQRDSGGQALDDMDFGFWQTALRVNTLAPFKMAQAFRGHLAASQQRKLVTISSGMGSVELAEEGFYAYRSSKAAVNMVMAILARELAPDRIIVGVFSPGWVRTRMGGPTANLSVEESISGLREQIARLTLEDSGQFRRHDGSSLPW